MNKYLSYEKSKRLSELGYLGRKGRYWCTKGKINEDHSVTYTKVLKTWSKRFWLVASPKHTNPVFAPDCHDLLTKLEELCVEYNCTLNVFIRAKKLCCTLYTPNTDCGVVFYEGEPLVEIFGAALIALLESNVEEKGADAPGGANAR